MTIISYTTRFSVLVGGLYSNYYLNGRLELPMFCGNRCKHGFEPYKICDSHFIPPNCQICFLLSAYDNYHKQAEYYRIMGNKEIQGKSYQ